MKQHNKEFLEIYNATFNKNVKGIIKFDMDDVLVQFDKGLLNVYNEKYNDNLQSKDMYDWDMTKYVKPECGNDIYELLKTPGLFRYLKPNPHSQEVVSRLIENGFEILIVSDSPRGHSHCDFTQDNTNLANPADDKRAWLQEHFPNINQRNVIFGSQKYFVRGDVLIDDKPETFEIFEKLELNAILIDRPYNQHIKTNKRAMNLLEAEDMIYNLFL